MKELREKRGRVLHYIDRSHGSAASSCFIDTPLRPISFVSSCRISILYPMSMKISSLLGQIPTDNSDIDSAERLGRGGSPTNSIPSSFFFPQINQRC